MAGVAVKVLAADVLARLQGMEERGYNLTGVFRNFGERMKGSIEENFAKGGRPEKWKPLSFSTLVGWHTRRKSFWTKSGGKMTARGKEAWSGRLPLTDTARLRRSVNYLAGARSLSIGTNVIYAAIHQFGGQAGRGHKSFIPARPFLVFQDEDVSYFERSLLDYILTRRLV